jgi:hypothetical protein
MLLRGQTVTVTVGNECLDEQFVTEIVIIIIIII